MPINKLFLTELYYILKSYFEMDILLNIYTKKRSGFMKSRLILTLAVLILFMSIVFVSCKKDEKALPAEKGIFAGADYLPQDSAFFLSADWASISKIEAFEKEINEMKEEIKGEVGIDVFEGLEAISMAVMDFDTKDFEQSAIVVLKGSFDKDSILQAIRSQEDITDILETEYEKTAIYTPQDNKGSDMSLAFMGQDTVLLSGIEMIKKAVDVKHKKVPSINSNKTIAEALKGIKKGSQIYGVGIVDQQMKDSIAKDPMSASFAAIDIFTLALLFDTGKYEVNFTGRASTQEDAKQIVNTLNGFWEGMAKPMLMGEPQYAEFADILKIDLKGTDAVINITITEEQIEKIKNLAPGIGQEDGEAELSEEYEDEDMQGESYPQ